MRLGEAEMFEGRWEPRVGSEATDFHGDRAGIARPASFLALLINQSLTAQDSPCSVTILFSLFNIYSSSRCMTSQCHSEGVGELGDSSVTHPTHQMVWGYCPRMKTTQPDHTKATTS